MINKTKLLNKPDLREYLTKIYVYRTLADHFYDYGNGYKNVSLYYLNLTYSDLDSKHSSANYAPIDAKACEDSYVSARNLLKVV